MSDSFITVEFVNNAGGAIRQNTEVLEGTTLQAFLDTKLSDTDGKVVKVNNERVDSNEWDESVLEDGDSVRVTAANIKGA